jgi:hypothetical protein
VTNFEEEYGDNIEADVSDEESEEEDGEKILSSSKILLGLRKDKLKYNFVFKY